ncbi:MAG: hypothetical protein GY791_21445 [Alphaproteobacteria bacterium]|nr:hypothetical protein [Alphaproteobacteria bacterium]
MGWNSGLLQDETGLTTIEVGAVLMLVSLTGVAMLGAIGSTFMGVFESLAWFAGPFGSGAE